MKIGIDATPANRDKKTGTEWYTYHLIEAMKQLPLNGDEVFLYSQFGLQGNLAELPEGWHEKHLQWPVRRGWIPLRLSLEMLINPPDVLFVPANVLPMVSPRCTVTTVHDVGFRDMPGLYEDWLRKRLESSTKRAVAKAAKIVSVTQFTKERLVAEFGAKVDKIDVVHSAFDDVSFRPLDETVVDQVRDKYGLGKNLFLYIGRLEEKKNVAVLIKAFDRFKANDNDFQLVLAGSAGYGYEKIKSLIDSSKYCNSIKELGWVEQGDLPALMNAATAFVFPSNYEGFGIPILEAMASGTAVIASDIPPLREVGGQAAVFVDPANGVRWADAMNFIVKDFEQRKDLIEKGIVRSVGFRWQQTAKQTLEILRSCGKSVSTD